MSRKYPVFSYFFIARWPDDRKPVFTQPVAIFLLDIRKIWRCSAWTLKITHVVTYKSKGYRPIYSLSDVGLCTMNRLEVECNRVAWIHSPCFDVIAAVVDIWQVHEVSIVLVKAVQRRPTRGAYFFGQPVGSRDAV